MSGRWGDADEWQMGGCRWRDEDEWMQMGVNADEDEWMQMGGCRWVWTQMQMSGRWGCGWV